MAAGDVGYARKRMEEGMVDTCQAVRPSVGVPEFDPVTGDIDPDDPATIYVGKCQVNGLGTSTRMRGGETEYATLAQLSIPWDAPQLLVGDLVTVTTSVNDEGLGGIELTVIGLGRGTRIARQRVTCEYVRAGTPR